MALPGSQLYKDAISKKIKVPDKYEEFSFHGYDTLPLATETLGAAEILKFRDLAFEEYHSNPKFLENVRNKFGVNACESIKNMLQVKLKRKIYN